MKERLNGLKVSSKIQKIESIFKYKLNIYNVQRNFDGNHRGIKMIWNNKLMPSLNFIKGEISQYGSKVILKHYHYQSDPKLGSEVFAIRGITCSYKLI